MNDMKTYTVTATVTFTVTLAEDDQPVCLAPTDDIDALCEVRATQRVASALSALRSTSLTVESFKTSVAAADD
jgi:hypothetical protein